MNTTEYFKRTIQAYLEERAMEDELFAAKYDNPDKNIDDCGLRGKYPWMETYPPSQIS